MNNYCHKNENVLKKIEEVIPHDYEEIRWQLKKEAEEIKSFKRKYHEKDWKIIIEIRVVLQTVQTSLKHQSM